MEVADAGVEARRVDQPGGDRGLAHALDHRRERPAREAVDQLGPARVGVDHARRDTRRRPSPRRPSAGTAGGRSARPRRRRACSSTWHAIAVVRGGAVGVEVRGAVIALDHGDRPAGPDQPGQRGQRLDRVGEVLEQEADEHVVERRGRERRVEDVAARNSTLAMPAASTRAAPRRSSPAETSIEGEPGARAARGQRDRLGADAAARPRAPCPRAGRPCRRAAGRRACRPGPAAARPRARRSRARNALAWRGMMLDRNPAS